MPWIPTGAGWEADGRLTDWSTVGGWLMCVSLKCDVASSDITVVWPRLTGDGIWHTTTLQLQAPQESPTILSCVSFVSHPLQYGTLQYQFALVLENGCTWDGGPVEDRKTLGWNPCNTSGVSNAPRQPLSPAGPIVANRKVSEFKLCKNLSTKGLWSYRPCCHRSGCQKDSCPKYGDLSKEVLMRNFRIAGF